MLEICRPPGSLPLSTFSSPPLPRHPLRHILTLSVRPSRWRPLHGSGRSLEIWEEGRREKGREGRKKVVVGMKVSGVGGRENQGKRRGGKIMKNSKISSPPRTEWCCCPPRLPILEICKARGKDAPFTLIPIDRCVPSGFKVSFLLHQPAPISVFAGVGRGSSQRQELGSWPRSLEFCHRNFPQPLRASGGPLCLSSRMPSSGKPAARDQRGARACETDRSLPRLRLPPPPSASLPPSPPLPSLSPPSSGIQASSVSALVSLEGAGQRSHAMYLKSNQADLSP